jgi:leader peptidase (prepilin peptidase)/N-methyltransferase
MNTPWPFVVIIAILGLAIGSFLNVVIYRVPRSESVVSPGSHCPRCDVAIKGRHNVPVLGWLVLRGRCANCTLAISPRYPLVEAGTALLFAAITLRFGLTVELPAFLYLAAIGVALAMIDFDVRRLPDSIVLPSYVVSIALLMPAGAATGDWHAAARGLIGMVLLIILLFSIALAYPSNFGFNDVKLAGLLGLYLAWLSWDALLIGFLATLAIGGLGGAAAVATKHGTRAMAVPLGTCLVAATVLAVFVAVPVTSWYGSMLIT